MLSALLAVLGRLTGRRGGGVLVAAVLLSAAAAVTAAGVIPRLHTDDFDDPGAESWQAGQVLQTASGHDPDATLLILAHTEDGFREAGPASSAANVELRRVAAVVNDHPDVVRVMTPAENPALLSADGKDALIAVNFKSRSLDDTGPAVQRIRDELDSPLQLTFGGPATATLDINKLAEQDLVTAEMVAFPILFLLLLLAFRSVVAALLPLIVGAVSVVGALAALRLVNLVSPVSIYSVNLVSALGLGLAVDYSLFLVYRYREEVRALGYGAEALGRTLATAGRTVLFSGLTVALCTASLTLFPQSFLYSMGYGGTIVALLAALASLTITPALMGVLGRRIDALSLRRTAADPGSSPLWRRLSTMAVARPVIAVVAAGLVIGALSLPALGMRTTGLDSGILPRDASARAVDTVLSRDFRPALHPPVNVALVADPGQSPQDAAREAADLAMQIGALPGALAVVPPAPVGGDTTFIQVLPRGGQLSDSAAQLVGDIRALPTGDGKVLVGGQAAALLDFKAELADRLPYVVGLVSLLSLLLLFAMTGSLLLPLKALAVNVATLAASYGVLVLIYQDGRLEDLLGYESQGALVAATMMLLFVLVFGIATDYTVFLLGRVQECRSRGLEHREAIELGVRRTGSLITIAAALVCVALGALVTSHLVFLKEIGTGLVVAVLLDATLVRILLVPGAMRLLGEASWWLPGWLRSAHRVVSLDHGADPVEGSTPQVRIPM